MPRGKYVVIEGHDGTGKSTQVELLRAKLKEQGIDSVEMHEPGGIAFADRLREVIKDGSLERSPITNLLLFTAARRELWQQLALPALEKGDWVIAARSWYSTLAYQGYGEGVDRTLIADVTRQFVGEEYLTPDYAFILTLDGNDAERHRRLSERGTNERLDTFESKSSDFQDKVNIAYAEIAKTHKATVIAAHDTPDEICNNISEKITLLH